MTRLSQLPERVVLNETQLVDSKNSKKLEVRNPKDDSVLATDAPLAGEADVEAAVAAGLTAFKSWRKTHPNTRRDCMLRLADLIEANEKPLAELTRISLGAPYGTFGSFEVNLCCEALRYFAGWTDKFPGEAYPQEDGFMKIVRNEPLGVTCGVIPWNGPLANSSKSTSTPRHAV